MRSFASNASLLAGDVGGTKILIGLFAAAEPRPQAIAVHEYESAAFHGFEDLYEAFASQLPQIPEIEAVALGVAGPVIEGEASLTNGTWSVRTREVARLIGTERVGVLNDLAALGHSVTVLAADELEELQAGEVAPHGAAAVIAAGTGLGEVTLRRSGEGLIPVPSEAGHADFAAREESELELVRYLTGRLGRVSVEHVVSGPGLVNLFQFTHRADPCAAGTGSGEPVTPAAVSEAALAGWCARCGEALTLFAGAYGAEAGNLALRAVATAGVFVGGGIAPKVLPALRDGAFMRAFRAKAPMTALVERIPVKVILSPKAGLLGAAVAAQRLVRGQRV